MSFDQKVVIITEGSSSIGAAIAKQIAKESATVVIVGTDEAKLESLAKQLVKLDAETLVIVADVSQDEEAEVIIKQTIEKFGKLDVLINITGVSREAGFLAENFLETYDKVMNHMRGVVCLTYFAAPHLINTQGNIVNVSSVAGSSNTKPSCIAYRASKAAMNDFTKSVALDLATHGVRVNTISPSLNRTDFDGLKVKSEIFNNNPASSTSTKLSEPSEIADWILYVASDKGKGFTGSNFWRKPAAVSTKVSKPTQISNMILYEASDKGKGITDSIFWRKLQLNEKSTVGGHSLT